MLVQFYTCFRLETNSLQKCCGFIRHLPVQTSPTAYDKDIFYMRPKPLTPVDADSPWYEGIPIGKKTLHKMLCKGWRETKVKSFSKSYVRR